MKRGAVQKTTNKTNITESSTDDKKDKGNNSKISDISTKSQTPLVNQNKPSKVMKSDITYNEDEELPEDIQQLLDKYDIK